MEVKYLQNQVMLLLKQIPITEKKWKTIIEGNLMNYSLQQINNVAFSEKKVLS